MKKTLAEKYAEEQTIRQQYDRAKAANDEAGKDAAREAYHAFEAEIDAEGTTCATIYKWYSEAQDRGNTYIDLNDCIWDRQVEELINSLRESGVERFTFSSTWSGSVETAWHFLENGCRLEGLVEINSPHKNIRTDEYEKVHGYLFSL